MTRASFLGKLRVISFAASRLKGITGFISILGDDKRISLYNRFDHVQRVVFLVEKLCKDRLCDCVHEAILVAHLHDINRLPFAHNLEKAINYSQSSYLVKYCEMCGIILTQDILESTINVMEKEIHGSEVGKLVYSADAALGFVEDTIFSYIALNMHWSAIPDDIITAVGFDESIKRKLDILKQSNQSYDENTKDRINALIINCTLIFMSRHSPNQFLVESKYFQELRALFIEKFMRKQVFPINNEQVSHGSRLANEIGIPYINLLKDRNIDPYEVLLTMTDQQLLSAALSEKLISNPQRYYPSLP